MGRFLTLEAEQALTGAIEAIEGQSSAEVVISVQADSSAYREVDFALAAAAVFGVLAFLLYSPWEFPLWAFLVDPLLAGGLTLLVTSRLSSLHRWLVPTRVLRRRVLRAARDAFCAKGIGKTSGRTGMLIYVSQAERMVELVLDTGIEQAVPSAQWGEAVAQIQRAVARGEDGMALARWIERLGALLGPALPRRADDLNELPDVVC